MNELLKVALHNTKKQNTLENELSVKWYGIPFDKLDDDDKELIQFEAADLFKQGVMQ